MFFDRVSNFTPYRLFSKDEALHFCDVSYIEKAQSVSYALFHRLCELRYINGSVCVKPTFTKEIFYAGGYFDGGFLPFYKIIFSGSFPERFTLYTVNRRSPDFSEKELVRTGIFLEGIERYTYRRVRTVQRQFSCGNCAPNFFEDILDIDGAYFRDFLPRKKVSYEYFSFNGEEF